MSRFLRKKTDKWPSGGRDEDELARDFGKLVKAGPGARKGKRTQRGPAAGPQTALPKLDTVDFRTSLILPGLSKRFSVLKPALNNEVSESDLRNRLATQRTRTTGGPSLTIEEEELVLAELRLKRQEQDDWDGEPPAITSFHSSTSSSASPTGTSQSTSNPSLHSYYFDQAQSPPPSSTSFGSLNTFGGGTSTSVLERDRGVSRAYGSTSTSGMREAEYIRRTRKHSEARRVSASNSRTSLAESVPETEHSIQTPVQVPSPKKHETILPFSGARVSSRPGSRSHSPSASISLAMGSLPPQQLPPGAPLPSPPLSAVMPAEAPIPRSPRRRSLLAGLTPAQVKRISAALVEIEEELVAPKPEMKRSGSEAAIQEEAEDEDENEDEEQDAGDLSSREGEGIEEDVEQLHDGPGVTAESSRRGSTPSWNDPSTPTAAAFAHHTRSSKSYDYASASVESTRPSPLTADAVAKGYVPGMVRPFGSPTAETGQFRQRTGSTSSQHSQASGRARSGSTPLPPARVSSLARSQSSRSPTPSRGPTLSRGPTPTPPVSIAQLRNGSQPSGIQHQPYHFMRRPSSPLVNQVADISQGSPDPIAGPSKHESASSMGSVMRAHIAQVSNSGLFTRSHSAASQSSRRQSTASPLPGLSRRESVDSMGSSFSSDGGQADLSWDTLLGDEDDKKDEHNLGIELESAVRVLAGAGGLSKEVLEEMQDRLVRNAKEIRDALRGPASEPLPQAKLVPRPSFRGKHVSTLPEDEDELRRAISPPPVASPPMPSRHQHNPSQTSIQRMLRGRTPVPVSEEAEPLQEDDTIHARMQPTPELSETSRRMSSEPATPRQDSPTAKVERTQALAQALFGEDGKLFSPEPDSQGFMSVMDLPEPPQHPISIRDDPAVIRDYEERIAKATAMLQRTPSAAKPLTRKGTKRGQTPKVISSPQLVSSTAQVPTTPLSPPGSSSRTQTDIDPTIARALEKASGTKMSARIKRFASFKRAPTTLDPTSFASPTHSADGTSEGGLAAPIDLQADGLGSAPAVMDRFKFPNAGPSESQASPAILAAATAASALPSPPQSANPQGLKGVMTRFKRNRKKSDAAQSQSDPPGYGQVEPKEVKALIRSTPGQPAKPAPPTLQLHRGNSVGKSILKKSAPADRQRSVKPSDDAALSQLYNAADALGLDSHDLEQLLANSKQAQPDESASERLELEDLTSGAVPPLPLSILRTSGAQPNTVVRRTIIIPSDVDAAMVLSPEPPATAAPASSQRKLSVKRKPVKLDLADRELVSGSPAISHRRGDSVPSNRQADGLDPIRELDHAGGDLTSARQGSVSSELLSPTYPTQGSQLPASPSAQSFATSNRRSSAGGSLYDLYADYHNDDDSSQHGGNRLPTSLSQHAVEICELSDGQVVWSVVEGLRDFQQPQRDSVYSQEELQSQYAYSRPVSAIVPRESSQPLQLYMKGQQCTVSGSVSSASNPHRRLAQSEGERQGGGERPETKVYYSSSNNVVDLIDSLSRNLDQGRFDIIPDSVPGSPAAAGFGLREQDAFAKTGASALPKTSTPASLVSASSDGHGRSKTVEQRLQALLDRMQAAPQPESHSRF